MNTLIQRILAGDSDAVTELYQKYSPKILRYLQKKLPKEDAQELTQDVFLEAFDELSFFQEKSSLSTWLYRIAHNKMVDFYRKRKIKLLLLSKMPFLQIITQEIHQPEFQYEKNRIRANIEATFHQLSKKYRTILKLHYEEQLPIKQIAIEMSISHKAAESLLYRARQDFIKKYEKG